ncbi:MULTISPECIES: hormogonium polysaccharide biosynthesis protein HpsA [unclassified Limnospira]|uniref:hormogonium polysaccharide biosynthesis protein HpsA n=1 Tax=unclassified Limnospira TaxID=2642885 RepID=UPI0028E1626E|nr:MULTISPECIES: hormogonium polysaccharide biosynthesis protein HpsA [unclassified Limnospira]MDT9191791.1 hormogonium polysaccharide biosynthesis protein HpsA [Limnospira sp. PMC 1245.20]MDT9207198.1 hormogonium polysaccharide biosynthesis protein HpsA [Limnospira sp. PMC 1252.20]
MHNQHNHRKPKLPIRLWLGEIRKFGNRAIGGLKRSLLGNWLNMNRGDRQRVEGFVLPTVTMVMLVVVLLTVAIAFRALDRAQVAQNVRVSQEVLLAATPALERASAKLDMAFERTRRAAPDEAELMGELGRPREPNRPDFYSFKDEERLTLEFDINENGTIDPTITTPEGRVIENPERIDTAWGFEEDFNGDGEADRYNIYGIFFRHPPYNAPNWSPGPRTPIDARGNPLPSLGSRRECQSIGSDSGVRDWYSAPGGLLKPFFIYSASIPVSGRGFAAVEMQEDRRAEPITVNAVLYEEDLDITPGQELRLNGRIRVNGNLVHVNTNNARINYYQVSSPASCYSEMELGKILVGGNVGFGQASLNQDSTGQARVHLFRRGGHTVENFTRANKPVNAFPNQMVTNQLEYAERISGLVFEQKCKSADTDPDEVKEAVKEGTDRLIALENYFRARTRRVPNVEEEDYTAPDWEHPQGCNQTYDRRTEGSGNDLRPVDRWIYPYNIRGGDATQSIPTVPLNGLALNGSGNKLNIPATHPDIVRENQRETRVGDRILVGNGLPARWYDSNRIGDNKFHGEATAQFIEGKEWDEAPSGESVRFRQTRMFDMPDLGDTGRNGFWERAAARQWTEEERLIGGLRVVTGAGIYWDEGSFLPPPKGGRDVVWPDTMPMGWDDPFDDPDKGYQKGHLKMRATVVYHYTKTPWEERGDRQEPIACISSYYDPTFYRSSTDNTGKNKSGLPWDSSAQGQSENGIVYAAQIEDIGRLTPSATPHNPYDVQSGGTGGEDTPTAATLEQKLQYQASLRFPDGRWVNEPLRVAIEKSPGDRTLADQSAIDAAVCAIKIMTDEAGTPRPDIIDHGTIYERTLLDGRQVKSLEDGDGFFADGKGTYDRAIEDRQPLEIRTTVIDLDKLRQKAIGSNEYLLPNSGIIYATRDDALIDDSTPGDRITSPVDFVVDETRRPNGIMLINGQRLDRPQGNLRERGLILVSNLPVYVKGNFNLHQTPGGTPLQEFTQTLNANWDNFYTRSTRDDSRFAVASEDQWRPATVLSDAVTLLSDAFREGFRNEGDYNLRNNMVLSLDYRNRRNLQPVKLQDGYDFRQGVTQFDESHFDFDLDGDGDQDDEDVGPNDLTLEAVRRLNGFYDNNFVTSASIWIPNRVGMWMDGASQERSSYLTNFVTPVQTRRGTEGIEYVMEMCRKPLVSMCNPEDWVVSRQNPATPEYASDKIGENFIYSNNDDTPTVGTTVQRILPSWERIYPRRIAFLRDRTHKLVLDKEGHPIPLGVVGGKYDYSPLQNAEICLDSDGKISLITEGESEGEYDRNCENGTMVPRVTTKKADALRFQMDGDVPKVRWEPNNESPDDVLYAQPMWEPVVQLNTVDSASGERWLQTPRSNTTFNLIIASGDSPIRQTNGNETELNGGLHNFTRFLEMWQGRTVNISGSFMQFKHSAYATGPMMSVLNQDSAHLTKFGPPLTSGNRPYRSANDNGQTTFYGAPNRNYGYDVGRMIFPPDLFDSRLVTPSTEPPNQYFREVSRDDPWVHTLLCGKIKGQDDGQDGEHFLRDDLLPAECPLDPDRFFRRT